MDFYLGPRRNACRNFKYGVHMGAINLLERQPTILNFMLAIRTRNTSSLPVKILCSVMLPLFMTIQIVYIKVLLLGS